MFGTIVDCVSVWKGVGGQSEKPVVFLRLITTSKGCWAPTCILNLELSQRGGTTPGQLYSFSFSFFLLSNYSVDTSNTKYQHRRPPVQTSPSHPLREADIQRWFSEMVEPGSNGCVYFEGSVSLASQNI